MNCKQHKCINNATNDYGYCHEHHVYANCAFLGSKGCKKYRHTLKDVSYLYCEDHLCEKEGCGESKDFMLKFCTSHIIYRCNVAGCLNNPHFVNGVRATYCQYHLCTKDGCKNYKYCDRDFCNEHTELKYVCKECGEPATKDSSRCAKHTNPKVCVEHGCDKEPCKEKIYCRVHLDDSHCYVIGCLRNKHATETVRFSYCYKHLCSEALCNEASIKGSVHCELHIPPTLKGGVCTLCPGRLATATELAKHIPTKDLIDAIGRIMDDVKECKICNK